MPSERETEAGRTLPGVVFEVERFGWVDGDRLELVGRWFGLRGQRFLRPTLDVEAGGERRRLLAVLEHKPWAAADGEDWIAAFTWTGPPAELDDAELTVSPDLAVPLPPASGSAPAAPAGRRRTVTAPDARPARRPRSAVLEAELGRALDEAHDLREQLRAEQASARGLETQLRQARKQLAAAEAAAEELGALREERDAVRAERDEAIAARDAASGEADGTRAEAEAARRDADGARGQAQHAAAEAEAARRARDVALEQLAAAEQERAAMAEARDRARAERNAWMQRARAAAAGRPSTAMPRWQGPAPPAPDAASPPGPAGGPGPPAPVDPPGPSRPADNEPASPPPGGRRTIRIAERAPAPELALPHPHGRGQAWRSSWERGAPWLIAVLALLVVAVLAALALGWLP